jgi:two-component system, sensor histidine kinase LadS
MLYQIAYTGMGKIYIWNGELEWNRRSLVVLGSLSFLALIQFSKRFLSMQIRSVILFNIANVFLVSLFLNSILGFIIPIHISDPLTHIISFLTCIYLLIACIKIFNSGINIVKFYLVGLVTLILSILFFNLFALGILQYTILRHSIEVGTLVELFIFNIAIWAKIHALNLNQESMATTSIKNTKNLNNNDLIEEDLLNQSPPEESRTREFHNDNSPRQTNKISSRIEKINIPTILKNLDQLMNENIFYDEDLTLARLASFLEIRPDQLSEILNKKMDMNFNQYINGIRIKEVQKELDRSSPRNVLDLAFSVGFNSKSAFNKAFREIVGVTPRDYRKESNKILH